VPDFTLPADSDLSAIAIFNVLDDQYAGGMSIDNVGSLNQQALQAAVDAAELASGGVILLPSIGTYKINGQIIIGRNLSPPSPISLVFAGTGQGQVGLPTLLKVKDDGVSPDDTDLFVVETGASHAPDIGGTTFQDLQIQYISGSTAGAAIHATDGSENVRVARVVFSDCPIGVWFEKTLQGNIFGCTAVNYTNPGTPVVLGTTETQDYSAIETYIAACLFRSNGTGTALQIYSVEHVRADNLRLDGYLQGILITPGALMEQGQANFYGNVEKCYFTNISCFPFNDPKNPQPSSQGAGLFIQPANGHYIQELWFAHCEFTPPESGTAYSEGGIVIDPTGGAGGGGSIDQIRFVDCYSCLWPGPGMDIVGGTNIEILGGYYSCNGVPLSPPSSLPLAGIALTGTAMGVRITGAACNNSIVFHGVAEPPTQEIGVFVAGASSSVRIHGCDLTGNLDHGLEVLGNPLIETVPTNVFVKHCDFTGLSAPVSVTTPVNNLQITDCPGYNDQATIVSTAAPPSGTAFNGAYFGYYGPVTFFATPGAESAISEIAIKGTNTHLTSGTFALAPGLVTVSYAVITYTTGIIPLPFTMVGE
jgi:hypothetical protein